MRATSSRQEPDRADRHAAVLRLFKQPAVEGDALFGPEPVRQRLRDGFGHGAVVKPVGHPLPVLPVAPAVRVVEVAADRNVGPAELEVQRPDPRRRPGGVNAGDDAGDCRVSAPGKRVQHAKRARVVAVGFKISVENDRFHKISIRNSGLPVFLLV